MGWYQMSEGRVLRGEPEGGKRSDVIPYGDPKTRTRFTRVWYFVDLDRENEMPDAPPSPTLDTKLTTNIVAAYVRRNQIGADQLPIVTSTVHQALAGLGESKAETEIERTPAVSIRQSVHRDYVVSLDCGWRGQMLKRHLATGHGLSVQQYRVRWNLAREHPMTAPSRSGLAKELGLGRGRRSPEKVEAVVPETPPAPQQRSRRPRRPRSPTTMTEPIFTLSLSRQPISGTPRLRPIRNWRAIDWQLSDDGGQGPSGGGRRTRCQYYSTRTVNPCLSKIGLAAADVKNSSKRCAAGS
jgi:predicted transcriptional regulator